MSSESYGDPDTRRRLLEAAWQVLEERGAEMRLIDVAERAGVSRQAVYLHFGDRKGLLVTLVQHMDHALGVEQMAAHVFEAANGVEMLERTVELYARLSPGVDQVAQVMEGSRDEAVRAAWRDRMETRRSVHGLIFQRLADEGQLARGWTVDSAADLFHGLMLPAVWRELTREIGWTHEKYRSQVAQFLRSAFVAS